MMSNSAGKSSTENIHMNTMILNPTDFVALVNQTLEYAYSRVTIVGELANLKISKNRWVYFDLKDELSSVKFFGTVYQLSGPLEDGLMLKVVGVPRLHPQYGFSVTINSILPVGEGSIKKAAHLLESKLKKEGLFDNSRKRNLVYPPSRIGLICSTESAAYHDFKKILNDRWCGLEILIADIQVQGENAVAQIIEAINYFNTRANAPDTLVITRGGGSADDLAVFNIEQVVRAIAGSRVPTLVAVGHENDTSLSELVADLRASTPSNAAELLVPSKKEVSRSLVVYRREVERLRHLLIEKSNKVQSEKAHEIEIYIKNLLRVKRDQLSQNQQIIQLISPQATMRRGYAVVRSESGKIIKLARQLQPGSRINIQFQDTRLSATTDKTKVE
jgi:exodeoxyribonuclease VII large subunit